MDISDAYPMFVRNTRSKAVLEEKKIKNSRSRCYSYKTGSEYRYIINANNCNVCFGSCVTWNNE